MDPHTVGLEKVHPVHGPNLLWQSDLLHPSHFKPLDSTYSHILNSDPIHSTHIRLRTTKKKLTCPKLIAKNANSIVDQISIFPLKLTALANMSVNENFLDESKYTEFKITIINFIKDSKSLKKHKETYHLNYAQENTNLRLMITMKITYGLRMKFNRRNKQKRNLPERI